MNELYWIERLDAVNNFCNYTYSCTCMVGLCIYLIECRIL